MRVNIDQHHARKLEAPRFDRETPDLASILRSICTFAYETARDSISMPNINCLDDLYKARIDPVEQSISELECL
jgi:hypothetical protein